jgi:hypothetical protein
VVGITATAKLWIQDMDYDQYRPATPFKNKLVLIHVLLQSLDSIFYMWQMMASGWNRKKQQHNSGGHYSNHQIVNPGHGLWSMWTCYTISKSVGSHTCASSVTLNHFFTSGKWWPLGEIQQTSNSITVVGITATAKLWIQDMDYDQWGPAWPFKSKLVLIHGLLQSLWPNFSLLANNSLWVK